MAFRSLTWPPHLKPAPGAEINRAHPLARGLTRAHLYTMAPRDYDLVHGRNRLTVSGLGFQSEFIRRAAPGIVGSSIAFPVQGTDTYHAAHTPYVAGYGGGASDTHGDWDPEENGARPLAPFSCAVLVESTDVPSGNRWPLAICCGNFGGGPRAGFDIFLFNQATENWPYTETFTSSGQSSNVGYPGVSVVDGRPHLIVGGVNQDRRPWISVDGRVPRVGATALTSGAFNMRGKWMAHGHLWDMSQAFARLSDTRIGGWLFWKRELLSADCRLLWEELYGGLITIGDKRGRRTVVSVVPPVPPEEPPVVTGPQPFWSSGASNWQPWPGAITVSAQRYDVRWCTPGPEEACLLHAETVLDVRDIVEFHDDIAIPATPTRLPLDHVFRRILNVQLTVVQTTGEPVRVADVLDKSVAGPLVQTRLTNGTLTPATVDAIIKGY